MTVMPVIPMLAQKHDIAFTLWVAGQDENKLLVTAFEADEKLNGLTRIDVALTSTDADIDLTKLIDRPATLTIHHKLLAAPRHFSGVVAAVSRGDSGHHRTAYQLTILPALHRLGHVSDSRIFQQQPVPDIVKTILAEHGIDNVHWRLHGNHVAREYCVAYRETLLAFIERICAEEGIWTYYHSDSEGRHDLIFADEPTAVPDCPHQKQLDYNAMASGALKGVYCSHLSWREQLRSTAYTLNDYTFRSPDATMEHHSRAPELNGVRDAYGLYDYPGRYKRDDAGKPFTRHKIEAVRVDASTGEGIANAPHLSAGYRFQLTNHPRQQPGGKFLLLSVKHCGRQPQALGTDSVAPPAGGHDPFALASGTLAASLGQGLTGAGMTGAGTGARAAALGSLPTAAAQPLAAAASLAAARSTGSAEDRAAEATLYGCCFTVMPARLPYRPPHTMKPLVDGPQMAHVVGPPGEEIFCDEHGRVKVQFPWDRYGRSDDKSSCWIRVAHNWGGATWGHIALPRIGHEVIVDFLEGDPDQPIIIGRTYHAGNRPPYKLPDHKTKMVIRSDTHKGAGYNEISFEDENGQQNMFLHAQKDQTIKVLNNRAKRVEANQVESIGANKSIEVGGNHQEKIGGSKTEIVGGGLGALLDVLVPIVGAGASFMRAGAKGTGNGGVMAFADSLAATGDAAEAASMAANQAFSKSGNHFMQAGKEQQGTASALGNLLSAIMPLSGIMMKVIEKFRSDTIGLARTEQIGVFKSTTVGHTQQINVGQKFHLQCGVNLLVIEAGGGDDAEKGSKDPHITLKSGDTQLTINPSGVFTTAGKIKTVASGDHVIKGKLVKINS